MTLGQKQRLFARLLPRLLDFAHAQGYEVSFGEFWRSPETAAAYARDGRGIANSLHVDRLAADLNLFRNGTYLTDTSDHLPLGEYWESLHHLCCWGGRFRPRPDGNHYSLEHGGRK
jgi:hypothetical protein